MADFDLQAIAVHPDMDYTLFRHVTENSLLVVASERVEKLPFLKNQEQELDTLIVRLDEIKGESTKIPATFYSHSIYSR